MIAAHYTSTLEAHNLDPERAMLDEARASRGRQPERDEAMFLRLAPAAAVDVAGLLVRRRSRARPRPGAGWCGFREGT